MPLAEYWNGKDERMDDLQRAVLQEISRHIGPEAAITRADLLARVGEVLPCSDRQMRRAIEWLRANDRVGANIVAAYPSDGQSGYFLARNRAEALEYMRPDWKRANELMDRLRAQERLLTGSDAQMGML